MHQEHPVRWPSWRDREQSHRLDWFTAAFIESRAQGRLEQFAVHSWFLDGVCQPSGNLLRQIDSGQKLKFRTLKEKSYIWSFQDQSWKLGEGKSPKAGGGGGGGPTLRNRQMERLRQCLSGVPLTCEVSPSLNDSFNALKLTWIFFIF